MDWKKIARRGAILSEMVDHDTNIPLIETIMDSDYSFVIEDIRELFHEGYLRLEEEAWEVSSKGHAWYQDFLGIGDFLASIDIFGAVDLQKQLQPGQGPESEEGDVYEVHPWIFDPRFGSSPTSQDVRIEMYEYMQREHSDQIPTLAGEPVPAELLVFFPMYQNNYRLLDLRLGKVFQEAEKFYQEAFRLTDLGIPQEEIDLDLAPLYSTGVLEREKKEGPACGSCGAPLFCYDLKVQDSCPNPLCGVSYREEVPETITVVETEVVTSYYG